MRAKSRIHDNPECTAPLAFGQILDSTSYYRATRNSITRRVPIGSAKLTVINSLLSNIAASKEVRLRRSSTAPLEANAIGKNNAHIN
jgi:hypothetical protein